MDRIKRFASRFWKAIIATGVLIGILTGVPTIFGWHSKLGDTLPEVGPVLRVALDYALYFSVLVGALSGASYLVYQWVLEWRDLRRDGRSIREFQAMAGDIENCNSLLVSYLERPRRSGLTPTNMRDRYAIRTQVNILLNRLRQLEIPAPSYEQYEGLGRSHYLIGYLTTMERLAEAGELWTARRTIVEEIVVESEAQTEERTTRDIREEAQRQVEEAREQVKTARATAQAELVSRLRAEGIAVPDDILESLGDEQ